MFDRILSKRNVFAVSLLYIILLIGLFFFERDCYSNALCRAYIEPLTSILVSALLPLIVVFLISIFSFRLDSIAFQAWTRFLIVAIPFFSVAIAIVASMPQSGGLGIAGPISQAFHAALIILLLLVFLISSLVVIRHNWSKSKKK